MNIQEAKKEICHTLKAYLMKDEHGTYSYPVLRQRPILLMGPPGIGKTAVVEQAARMWAGLYILYNYPSYQTECHWTSGNQSQGL